MDIKKIQLPTIHLNGTSLSVLTEQTQTARKALRDAVEALQEASPNARDYYPQGESAVFAAQREHEQRVAKLSDVLLDLDTLIGHLYDHE